MTFHEVGGLRLTLDRFDQGVRELLFRVGDDALDASAILEDDGAVGLDVVLPRLDRLLVDVDVPHRNLRTHVFVLDEPAAKPIEVVVPSEDGDRHRVVERFEDSDRLV